jgi:galactoside O-acetyltransferase
MTYFRVIAILFKRFLFSIHRGSLYLHKFGYLPPSGTVVEGVENLKVGKKFSFGIDCEFYCQSHNERGNGRISIGDNVSLNSRVSINASCGGNIIIGNDVLVGPGVIMRASNHAYNDRTRPIREQGHVPDKIIIEDNVWIGAGAIILPGVHIKKGAIVGAGAVVSKDVEANTIFAGVPAKFIKER